MSQDDLNTGLLERLLNTLDLLALISRETDRIILMQKVLEGIRQVLDVEGSSVYEIIRKSDVRARWGGEEFILALPDTNAVEALRISDSLRLLIERNHVEYEGNRLNVTVSAGISTFDGMNARSLDDVVREADEALYNSKKAGRNRVTLFGENR